MIPLTIIVVAYNRSECLCTLLTSLTHVKASQTVDLVISIDDYGTKEINSMANSFEWHLGKKEVVLHKEHLGIIKHRLWVGDQTQRYEHILYLEDDLYVSPEIVNYALQVIPFYEEDDRVAGCCLYNPHFTLSWMPFDKIEDGYDNFFFQHPYWGNIWYRRKWNFFKEYWTTYSVNHALLPLSVRTWNSESFNQIFIQYLIETGRTMVYPRVSLLSNTGAAGLHMGEYSYVYSTLPVMATEKHYRFSTLDQSLARYDAFEELDVLVVKKQNPSLRDVDFELDTKCNKDAYKAKYVLTPRRVTSVVQSFSTGFKPIETAVLMNISGSGLHLTLQKNVVFDKNDVRQLIINSWRTSLNMDSFMLQLTNIKTHFVKRWKPNK